MENRNGQVFSNVNANHLSKKLNSVLVLLLVLLGTACTKGDDTQCGTPENPCDEIITEEIVDY